MKKQTQLIIRLTKIKRTGKTYLCRFIACAAVGDVGLVTKMLPLRRNGRDMGEVSAAVGVIACAGEASVTDK